MRQRGDGDDRDHRFGQQAGAAGKAGMCLLGDFQIIVIKTDQPEAERHPEHDPYVRAGRVGPQQGRDQQAGQDHQPAHGRRAHLGQQMRLRAVGADRLALALLEAQQVDDRAAEQEHEHQSGDDGAAGAERDVAEDVEERDLVGKFGQPIKHRCEILPLLHSGARPAVKRFAPAPARARPAGELPFQRLDDRPHFRAQRTFHHHRVAGADGGEHGRLQPRRGLGIAAPAAGGKGLPQRVHQRPTAKHQVDGRPLRSVRPKRGAAPALGCPSSSMSPKTAMRRPWPPTGAWPSSAMAAAIEAGLAL